jgi:hypothetical protein
VREVSSINVVSVYTIVLKCRHSEDVPCRVWTLISVYQEKGPIRKVVGRTWWLTKLMPPKV